MQGSELSPLPTAGTGASAGPRRAPLRPAELRPGAGSVRVQPAPVRCCAGRGGAAGTHTHTHSRDPPVLTPPVPRSPGRSRPLPSPGASLPRGGDAAGARGGPERPQKAPNLRDGAGGSGGDPPLGGTPPPTAHAPRWPRGSAEGAGPEWEGLFWEGGVVRGRGGGVAVGGRRAGRRRGGLRHVVLLLPGGRGVPRPLRAG